MGDAGAIPPGGWARVGEAVLGHLELLGDARGLASPLFFLSCLAPKMVVISGSTGGIVPAVFQQI